MIFEFDLILMCELLMCEFTNVRIHLILSTCITDYHSRI